MILTVRCSDVEVSGMCVNLCINVTLTLSLVTTLGQCHSREISNIEMLHNAILSMWAQWGS